MRFNTVNLVTYILAVLSVIILASTAYFLSNIKVLEDWRLTLPQQDIHVGDTIVVQSTYHKLRETGGESVRYIQCQNRNGVWIRYELNRATANRQAGYGGTGIVLTVRRDIADVPTKCKFTVAIRYDVLPFRKVYISNDTKEFTLLPERMAPESGQDELPATIQTNPSPIVLVNPVAASSVNNTAAADSTQPNSSQGTENSIRKDTSQSLIQSIIEPVRDLLGTIL